MAVLAGSLLAAGTAGAQQTANDEVRVGGRTYRGTVVEVRPRVSVRLRLADGDELTVPWSEVVSLDGTPRETLESGTPPLRTEQEAARSAPRTHWYGWQTLLVDGGSVVLLLAGAAPVGVVSYVVGAPIVHVAHRQYAPAVGSGLLRLTLPIAFAFLGAEVANAATPSSSGSNGLGAAFVGVFGGAFGGIVAASAIDASVFAWEPRARPPGERNETRSAPSVALVPTLSPSLEPRRPASNAGVALVGSF